MDELLILGLGQAEYKLHQSIDHHKGLKGKVVAMHSVSRLTEQGVIAEAE